MDIEKLKSNRTSETFSLKEHPESPVQDILQQSFLSDTVAETKAEQEVPTNTFIVMTNTDFKLKHVSRAYHLPLQSLTPFQGKYEKAMQKITMLKQEKVQLEQQVKEKDAEISE